MLILRYRLSTFFVLVAIIAAGCWWYTHIRPKRLAAASLRQLDLLQQQRQTGRIAWGVEMRRLVKTGPNALPVFIRSLDATPADDRLNLRTIPFALRCLDDPRAVPALIRAIPRCFGSDGSDMGYTIGDAELAEFLAQKHGDAEGMTLGYGRPVNEVFRALKHLTGQTFDHMELALVSKRDCDTERQTELKQALYENSALRWAEWWEANWNDFTNDRQFASVSLPVRTKEGTDQEVPLVDEHVTRASKADFQGSILEPVCAISGQMCFLDLDTHRRAILPDRFGHLVEPVAELPAEVFAWASREGFDLYGAVAPTSAGQCFVVRALETRIYELETPRAQKTMTLGFVMQHGRITNDLVAHWDRKTNQTQLESTGEFIFITKENTVGQISLGVEVDSIIQPAGRVPSDLNLQTSGQCLGRRIGLSYLVPSQ